MTRDNSYLGINILQEFTKLLSCSNINTNTVDYINIFGKVVSYIYSLYIKNMARVEQEEASYILSEIEDILRINIEILENTTESKEKGSIAKIEALRNKRNKLMEAHTKLLKESLDNEKN
ncbi:hypothetical protein DB313_06175 (plasmid) [Borrelia turcica IST7]|uniref:Uncharacterized protein n=1 Tax=Borrelia turcica IST7 TaxID=1104446 RepID=A0A386PNN8_9SPIR|nr:BlyB family putative holin accessory protein [Borrelia turcica]AYE37086.1 hypothetical protein DB313_06175 [Borrelia turcica IST7]